MPHHIDVNSCIIITNSLHLLLTNLAYLSHSQQAVETSHKIMKLAGGHNRNTRLSMNKMRTFLLGTQYESFVSWLIGTVSPRMPLHMVQMLHTVQITSDSLTYAHVLHGLN